MGCGGGRVGTRLGAKRRSERGPRIQPWKSFSGALGSRGGVACRAWPGPSVGVASMKGGTPGCSERAWEPRPKGRGVFFLTSLLPADSEPLSG